MEEYKGLLVNFISSWSPRICGIASFTQDTVDSIAAYDDTVKEIRMYPIDKSGLRYLYPIRNNKHVIRQLDTSSWKEVSKYIRELSHRKEIHEGYKSVVVLEHEFGLDGTGEDNNYNLVAKILKEDKIPTIAVLHTVKRICSDHEKSVLQELSKNCTQLVVLTPSALGILKESYDIKNVVYVPHGIPKIDKGISKKDRKRRFGLEDKIVIGTPGLMSKGKGIEDGILGYHKFLQNINKKAQSKFIYVIAGQTHPNVLAENNGQDPYREVLWDLCGSLENPSLNPLETKDENINKDGKLNLDDCRILFVNTHLGDNTLVDFIASEDTGILPYRDKQQSSSGIFFYHAGIGTPCASAGNVCAKDLFSTKKGKVFHINRLLSLDENEDKDKKFEREVRGVIFNTGDPNIHKQIAQSIGYNLQNSARIESNILKIGYPMSWPVVGAEYVGLFVELLTNTKTRHQRIPFARSIQDFE